MRVTAAKVEDLTQLTKVLGRFTTDQPLVDEEQRTVSVPMTDGIGGIASVSAELAAAGIPVSDFQVSRPSMDEVFLSLTNKAATRPENEGAAA
ncbi:hypothetical protein G3M58_32445 [Streptomyces sp. SID7499]|nr:hypothetical protein [Streptomyces sp. SID7499]